LEESNLITEKSYEVKKSWLRVLFDPGYVEHRKFPDWSGFLPFYRWDCSKHGPVVSYPSGYKKTLRCPLCTLEERQK